MTPVSKSRGNFPLSLWYGGHIFHCPSWELLTNWEFLESFPNILKFSWVFYWCYSTAGCCKTWFYLLSSVRTAYTSDHCALMWHMISNFFFLKIVIDQLDSFKKKFDFIHFPTTVPPYSPQPPKSKIWNITQKTVVTLGRDSWTPPISHFTYQ